MKTHYDTLGVPSSATAEEIKIAYRKLCMQTHPDVANNASTNHGAKSNQSRINAERFKLISEAYSVVGNEKARRRYDWELQDSMRFGIRDSRQRGAAAGAGRRGRAGMGAGSSASMAAALPRNLFIGSIIGIAGVALFKMLWTSDRNKDDDGVLMRDTGHRKLVEAWKNPDTGRWEKPRPWDPEYRRLKPELHFVPRSEVHYRKR